MLRDDMVVINGITMKVRHVVILEVLKTQALDQLNVNHMGIKKAKLLACELVYWVNINDVIEKHIKIALHVLHFSRHSGRTR